MQLKGNFANIASVGPNGITVSGTTSLLEGRKLVARRVTLQQGSTLEEGPATTDPGDWETDPPLPKEGFDAAKPALAVGVEVYAEQRGSSDSPSYVTMTWAENIKLS